MDELSDDLIVRPGDIFVLYASYATHDRYEDLQDESTSAPEKDKSRRHACKLPGEPEWDVIRVK